MDIEFPADAVQKERVKAVRFLHTALNFIVPSMIAYYQHNPPNPGTREVSTDASRYLGALTSAYAAQGTTVQVQVVSGAVSWGILLQGSIKYPVDFSGGMVTVEREYYCWASPNHSGDLKFIPLPTPTHHRVSMAVKKRDKLRKDINSLRATLEDLETKFASYLPDSDTAGT